MAKFAIYHGELLITEAVSMDSACDCCALCASLGYRNLTIITSDGMRMWHWN